MILDLGYRKSRTVSTADLPGVICDPPILFEFANAPSFEVGVLISQWDNEDVDQLQLAHTIAGLVLLSVTSHDGKRYTFGDEVSIKDFALSTSEDFLTLIIRGWIALVGTERLEAKKKSLARLNPSNSTASVKVAS